MAKLGAIVVAVLIAAVMIPANGDFIDSIQSVVNDAAKIAKSMCITHDNCYKDVFTLNNYCCLKKMGTCCNMFDFVFSGGDEKDVWNNFVSTFQDPRPINIVIIVLLLLAVFAVVSMLLSLIGYFFCGCARICCCCGQRKYTIVNH